MIGWIRIIFILYLVLIPVFFLWRASMRRNERKRLAEEYASVGGENEAAFIAAGLEKFERSLAPKLLWGLFLIPVALVVVLLVVALSGV